MDSSNGLLAAYLINKDGLGSEIDWPGIYDWQPSHGLIWINLEYNHAKSQEWLQNQSGLDPIVIEALSADETRPRYAHINNGLLITLRGVNLNPGADPEDMVAVRMWLDEQRVITTRRRYMLSEENMKKAIISGQGPVSSSEFLTDLAYYQIELMADVIEDVGDKVEQIESQLTNENIKQSQKTLTDLRKQIISLRRYLAPQRDVMLRLSVDRQVWFDDRTRLHLKEISDSIIRYIEDLDEARDYIDVIQQDVMNRLSDLSNKRMYLLSIIAGIFLPLSFITGLLGINVGGIPGASNPSAFLIVIVSLVALAVVLFLILRLKKWM